MITKEKQSSFKNKPSLECDIFPEHQENIDNVIQDDNKHGYTLEDAYEKVGGFGLFQWLMCGSIMTTFIFSYILTRQLPFLELVPNFRC